MTPERESAAQEQLSGAEEQEAKTAATGILARPVVTGKRSAAELNEAPPRVDLAEAQRFLEALAPTGVLSFQTFTDHDTKPDPLAQTFHGPLAEVAAKLLALNAQSAGIFVMVNAGDGKGRKTANVQKVRAAFVDLDGAPLEPVMNAPLPPHIVVQSSPGKWHAYWLLADCPLDTFRPLQKTLAAHFDGDPKVIDLPRVMRVPGFLHRKAQPFLVRVHHIARDLTPVTLERLTEALALELDAPSCAAGATEDSGANGNGKVTAPGRNSFLTERAGALRAKGYAGAALERALLEINAARCDPPLDANEVLGIARGIQRYKRKRPLTDLGNAERLADACHERMKFCPQMGVWFVWDGARWRQDEDGAVHRAMRVVVREMYTEANAENDDGRRRDLAKWATSSESLGRLKAAVELARSDSRLIANAIELDTDPWLLGVRNGVLDLHTGQLLPPDPQRLITKQALVAFDPRARAPLWEKVLNRIFGGDTDLIVYMQRFVGYVLTGDTMLKTMLFLHGPGGDNGKSTLCEALMALLGDYAVKTRAETFMAAKNANGSAASPERMALRGARLVVASELSDRQRFDEVFVKDVTGGIDRIAGRKLYQDMISFKPEFKMMLYGNHKPKLRSDDPAVWRRLHLVPFEVRIPPEEQDIELPTKLIAELPGILNWALAGLRELRENRMRLAPPKKVLEAVDEYREEMDTLGQYFGERCLVAEGVKAASGQMYEDYREWATDNGIEHPMTNAAFAQQMAERGFKKTILEGRKFWTGVGLRF